MLPIKENLTDLEKKESVHDDFPCIGFDLPTAEEAFAHFRRLNGKEKRSL